MPGPRRQRRLPPAAARRLPWPGRATGGTRHRLAGRRSAVAALALAALAALAGCGSSASTSGATSGGQPAATVTLRAAPLSQVHQSVVVDGSGFALYLFAPDHRRAVTCTGSCAAVWPPVEVSSRADVHAGSGIRSQLIGTLPGPGKTLVVTYGGWPLYRYASDTGPGLAAGQGLDLNGGYWYVLRPDGRAIVPAGDPVPSGASSPPTTGSGTSPGY